VINVRPAGSIYHKEGGWFSANWHFSFDEYYDPDNMGFGTMRVFNDDRLIPGAIWPMHPHRNVEGLTYVVEGTFRHEDSVGGGGVLPAGSVQRMTLGSGAYHSEQNASDTEPLHFIQIWIIPDTRDLPPGVEQKTFSQDERTNRLLRAIGPDRAGGSILVHRDASMFISRLESGASVSHVFRPNFGGYLFLIDGRVTLNGKTIGAGDAAVIVDERQVELVAIDLSELLMMEVEVR
jgi:hypothetical protein